VEEVAVKQEENNFSGCDLFQNHSLHFLCHAIRAKRNETNHGNVSVASGAGGGSHKTSTEPEEELFGIGNTSEVIPETFGYRTQAGSTLTGNDHHGDCSV
jgi:hypothetical protein